MKKSPLKKLTPNRKRRIRGDQMVKEFHVEHPEIIKAVKAEIMPDPPGAGPGRPTDYKPEYCVQLIEFMAQGYSFNAFAAKVRAGRRTLDLWVAANPDFMLAKEIGEAESLLFWETLGITGTAGKLRNFNAVAFIFNMKNRHGWKDSHELKVGAVVPAQQIEATPETMKLIAQIDKKLEDEY